MNDNEKLISIRQYASNVEASMIRDRLENAGIPCMLTNETFSSIYPLGYTSIGAIQLLVFERDAKAAIEIIDTPEEQTEQ